VTESEESSALLELARFAVSNDEWDSLPEFIVFRYSEGKLVPDTIGVMAGIEPAMMPGVMLSLAEKAAESGVVAAAYLLSLEGYGVKVPAPGTSPEELEQFERDRKGRNFHTRSDAMETKIALVASTSTDASWTVMKDRSTGTISENREISGVIGSAFLEIATSML
jgi:hypothetical protein